jgi:hypothetical protein
MEKRSKMTKQQKISFFKAEVKRFIKYFGLYDYEIIFDEQKNEDARATTYFYYYDDRNNADAQNVDVCWSKEWIESNLTKKEISKTAFHEVLEIMLYKLQELARCRNIIVTKLEVKQEKHRIIRILENTIFEIILDK